MEMLTMIYLVFGGVLVLTLFVVIGFIAGKDILRAFKRWINPKGCDVFISHSNRAVEHHYLTPENSKFDINDNFYLANPGRLMHLSDEEKKKAKKYITKNIEDSNFEINRFKNQLRQLKDRKKKLKSEGVSEEKLAPLQEQIDNVEQMIEKARNRKKKLKEGNKLSTYYYRKRPAFFFLEGDPIPKDFQTFYSGEDNQLLDNIMSRAATRPSQFEETKTKVDMLQKWLYGIGILALAAAFLSLMNNNAVNQICKAVGASCGMT